MDFLTGKVKLVFDACAKIERGKRLMEEGTIELYSLIPSSKLEKLEIIPSLAEKKVSRRLVAHKRLDKRISRSSSEVRDLIMKELEANPAGLSISFFNRNHGLNARRIRNSRKVLTATGKILLIGEGRQQKMIKIALKKK